MRSLVVACLPAALFWTRALSQNPPDRAAAKQAAPVASGSAVPEEPSIGIRFEGLLPGTHDPALAGTFPVAFTIYRSPQGGQAIWSETQNVVVAGGRMDVVLGSKTKIPMEVHEATFKFLGAAVQGGPEVYPRFAIVNVVYASPEGALLAKAEGSPSSHVASHAAVYTEPRRLLSDTKEKASTWRDALLHARSSGYDLPEYDDWYSALPSLSREAALERAGHYEWVLPWVYDSASHGRYNDFFRGRFQGCDYMDLSPQNSYVWRAAHARERPPAAGGEVKR